MLTTGAVISSFHNLKVWKRIMANSIEILNQHYFGEAFDYQHIQF